MRQRLRGPSQSISTTCCTPTISPMATRPPLAAQGLAWGTARMSLLRLSSTINVRAGIVYPSTRSIGSALLRSRMGAVYLAHL